MMRRLLPVVFLMTALGPLAPVEAQQPIAWVLSSAPAESPLDTAPFAPLLDRARELGLSPDQVNRIRELQRELLRENERLLAQLRDAAVFGTSAQDEEAIAAARAKFHENAAAAERAVEEVLNAEQREQARELLGEASLSYGIAEGDDISGLESVDQARTPEARSQQAAVRVTIDNQNFLDVNVFVYVGSRRERLGFVNGLTRQTFTLPARIVDASSVLYFQVQPIGRSAPPASDGVLVRPGDQVVVRIPPV